MPTAPLCGRCKSFATRGWGPPDRAPDRGRAWSCPKHHADAERWWLEKYPEARASVIPAAAASSGNLMDRNHRHERT